MKIRNKPIISGILLLIIILSLFPFYQFSENFNIENQNIQYLSIEEIETISVNNSNLYQNSTLEREYFKAYNWLLNKSTVSNSPLNISGITAYYDTEIPNSDYRYVEIEFDIVVGYSNGLMIFGHSEKNIFELNITKIENSDSIEVGTENEDILSFREGDMFLPFYYGWYIKEIKNNSVSISYTSWHTLTPFIQSSVRMYLSTYNETYLEIAKPMVNALLYHQTDSGLFIRQYGFEKNPVSQGMIQAINMYTLLEFYFVTGDKRVFESLLKAANSFKHSTEGTTNHWTNSILGSTISRLLLLDGSLLFEKNEINALLNLYEEDGKITYNLPGHQLYPNYKETYMTYDARILMRLAKFLKSEDIYNNIFPTAFDLASNNLNTGHYRVNNLLALYHGFSLGLHYNDERFVRWSNEFINLFKSNTSFHHTSEALDYMNVISALFSWKNKKPYITGTFPLSKTSQVNLFSSEFLHLDFKIRIADFGVQNLKLKVFFKTVNGNSIGKSEFSINSDILKNDIYTIIIPNINSEDKIMFKVAISDLADNYFYISGWNQISISKFIIFSSISLFLLGLLIKIVLLAIYIKKPILIIVQKLTRMKQLEQKPRDK